MIIRWMSWLNCTLLGLTVVLLMVGGIFWLKRPSEIACHRPATKESALPRGAFELEEDSYQKIGEPLLALQKNPLGMQLPDLKQQLFFYGKNGRPDAKTSHILLHFSLNGNKSVVSTPPGEKLYLIFDKTSSPGRYVFSPKNEKSSLWLEGNLTDNNEVSIQVTMENEKGEKIVEPEENAKFQLPEKEFIRYAGTSWEIGSYRVDGTLLVRQKARWYGADRFLEEHGGIDYQKNLGKQRVDFAENEELYSVFVKIGDCLIWKENRWQLVDPGEESLGFPLLVSKKIDDRLMTFELWDVEGKGKISLNLLKSSEPWTMHNAQSLQHMFKFLGARTRSQCVFEINRERMTLRPSDWLLLTSKGWKKLATPEEIDNYVKRKETGTLFVFDGISRKDERQIMLGTLYSPSRNDSHSVELPLQPITKTLKENKDSKESKESDETDFRGLKARDNDKIRNSLNSASANR